MFLPFGFRFIERASSGVRLHTPPCSDSRVDPETESRPVLWVKWQRRGWCARVGVKNSRPSQNKPQSHMYCVEPWPTHASPRWAIFLSVIHLHIFSPDVHGSSRPAVLNFITYLMFIFPQFINNRDVIPPSSFPNEFQTTQHGLHDWCVMSYNVVVVCRLTSPMGPGPYCWLSKLMSPVHMASVRSLPGSRETKDPARMCYSLQIVFSHNSSSV